MRLTVIVPDKTIIKNGIAVHVDDNSFWTDYTEYHAFQFDTENSSINQVEFINNGGTRLPTNSEQTIFSNKFDEIRNAEVTADENKKSNWANSWDRIRRTRSTLLKDSDWTQGSDSPLTDAKKTEWATYRTALRNIPTTYSEEQPRNITFDGNYGDVKVNGVVVITKPT